MYDLSRLLKMAYKYLSIYIYIYTPPKISQSLVLYGFSCVPTPGPGVSTNFNCNLSWFWLRSFCSPIHGLVCMLHYHSHTIYVNIYVWYIYPPFPWNHPNVGIYWKITCPKWILFSNKCYCMALLKLLSFSGRNSGMFNPLVGAPFLEDEGT